MVSRNLLAVAYTHKRGMGIVRGRVASRYRTSGRRGCTGREGERQMST
jgi:hypothetical protein